MGSCRSRGAGSAALLALCLALQLSCSAGKKFSYHLKRYKSPVDLMCVTTSLPVQATMDNADTLLIGSLSNAQAGGSLCTSIVWIQADALGNIFSLTDVVPSVLAGTSFNTTLWNATATDTVELTVQNGYPGRPLSMDGCPVPVELGAPNSTTDAPTSTTLYRPAKQFTTSYKEESQLLLDAMNWLTETYYGTAGVGAAIVSYPDPEDPYGTTLKALYVMFEGSRPQPRIFHSMKSTFTLSRSSKKAKNSERRRLLQYYGGTDGTSVTRTCKYSAALKRNVCNPP